MADLTDLSKRLLAGVRVSKENGRDQIFTYNMRCPYPTSLRLRMTSTWTVLRKHNLPMYWN